MGFRETERERERRLRESKDFLRRMSAGDDEVDEEIDEDEFEVSLADELVAALKRIERHRDELQAAASYFGAILKSSPELSTRWHEFQQAGGISSHDLRRFLDGQLIRYRPTRRRKHLRLVINKPTVIKQSRGGGGHAA